MDTREKIKDLNTVSALLETGEWTVVAGVFDPLTLTQAQRIAAAAQAGRRVLALVVPDADTLLAAEARAALVAGLGTVTAVVIADPRQINVPGSDFQHDVAQDRQRSAEFVSFIMRRQQSAEIPA